MNINDTTLPFTAWNNSFAEMKLEYAPEQTALFYRMQPEGVPRFSLELLDDIANLQHRLASFLNEKNDFSGQHAVKYLVHTSAVPRIFNLGGDLALFSQLIREQDRDSLSLYATKCINVLHANHVNLQRDITTIALLEGTAAGGGFEAALSSDVIIAERGTEMGFPEAVFNLFPGMGAFSFLSRRLSPVQAERIIKSGRMYSAEEMHELGIVDELAEPGQAYSTLSRYLKKHRKYAHMHKAMGKVTERVNRVSYEELIDITHIWVDAAMSLPASSLKTMERLAKAQQHRVGKRELVAENY